MSFYLLKEELQELQLNYKEVLLKAREDIFESKTGAVIDEIKVFWQRNKKLVEFALRNWVRPYETYVFTAATMVDIDDFEHYPFVTLGKFHIWDDPIYKYADIVGKTPNPNFNNMIKKQVLETIMDNLKILDVAKEIIYILPIRYFSGKSTQLACRAAEQIFLSLFDKKYTLEEYNQIFFSIDDVKKSLRTGIEKNIIFEEYEDTSVDLIDRFTKYKNTTTTPLSKDACDAKIFKFVIFSYFIQAFDTMLICAEYQLNPYLRYDVAFKYFVILSENFGDQKEIKDMIFKCSITYILYQTFDKEKVKSLDFRTYYNTIRKNNLESQLFDRLEEEGITIDNLNIKLTSNIIKELLNSSF